ncbi:proline-rich protein 18 [Petaurus breviceps papuanus]|uniref:proline-rich protein 18 n=1 Tax=Petaurus breviceps papuanus TaxID=3040969 RepID=UPI0036DCF572
MPFPPIQQQQHQQQQQQQQQQQVPGVPTPPPVSATAPRELPKKAATQRKTAVHAPPVPGSLAPTAGGEKKKRPSEKPEMLLSSSWPSATLKRQLARRTPGPAASRTQPQPSLRPTQQPLAPATATTSPPTRPLLPATCAVPGLAHSCESLAAGGSSVPGPGAGTSSGEEEAVRFSLSLTPEAILVIQRRNLEKQLLARQRRPFPSPAADTKRLLSSCPRSKAGAVGTTSGQRKGIGISGTGSTPVGGFGSTSRRPTQSQPQLLSGAMQPLSTTSRGGHLGSGDLRTLLKISLLNEHHKYDDVEYEEEAEAVDEGLVRKCTEWLRGVENAAATRDRAEKLETLPHLGTL